MLISIGVLVGGALGVLLPKQAFRASFAASVALLSATVRHLFIWYRNLISYVFASTDMGGVKCQLTAWIPVDLRNSCHYLLANNSLPQRELSGRQVIYILLR